MGKIKQPARVVFDTNVLVSALMYGGVPDALLEWAEIKVIVAITSPALLAELADVFTRKFRLIASDIEFLQETIYRTFLIVHTHQTISLLKDDPDNRVLETAISGGAQWIITGDREMLKLGLFRKIKIVTPRQFLDSL